jgi:hypothetical protein
MGMQHHRQAGGGDRPSYLGRIRAGMIREGQPRLFQCLDGVREAIWMHGQLDLVTVPLAEHGIDHERERHASGQGRLQPSPAQDGHEVGGRRDDGRRTMAFAQTRCAQIRRELAGVDLSAAQRMLEQREDRLDLGVAGNRRSHVSRLLRPVAPGPFHLRPTEQAGAQQRCLSR